MDTQAQTFRVLGRRTPKVDALDKVTGRAQFGADVALPRLLVGHGGVQRGFTDAGDRMNLPTA